MGRAEGGSPWGRAEGSAGHQAQVCWVLGVLAAFSCPQEARGQGGLRGVRLRGLLFPSQTHTHSDVLQVASRAVHRGPLPWQLDICPLSLLLFPGESQQSCPALLLPSPPSPAMTSPGSQSIPSHGNRCHVLLTAPFLSSPWSSHRYGLRQYPLASAAPTGCLLLCQVGGLLGCLRRVHPLLCPIAAPGQPQDCLLTARRHPQTA